MLRFTIYLNAPKLKVSNIFAVPQKILETF